VGLSREIEVMRMVKLAVTFGYVSPSAGTWGTREKGEEG